MNFFFIRCLITDFFLIKLFAPNYERLKIVRLQKRCMEELPDINNSKLWLANAGNVIYQIKRDK